MPRPEIVRPYLKWAASARSTMWIFLSSAPWTMTKPGPSVSRSCGVHLELLGRDLEHRLARLARGHDDRVADAMRRAAGERAHVVRPGVRVGGVDEHEVHRQAERLGRDLRDHRLQALAEVGGRERDDERARRRRVDERLRRVAAEVHAGRVVDGGMPRAAQLGHQVVTPSCVRATTSVRQLSGSSWPTSFAARLHHLDQRRVLGELAVRLHVAVAVGVMSRSSRGSMPSSRAMLVHLDLEREVGDRHAEAAHRRWSACGSCRRSRRRPRRWGSRTGPACAPRTSSRRTGCGRV